MPLYDSWVSCWGGGGGSVAIERYLVIMGHSGGNVYVLLMVHGR